MDFFKLSSYIPQYKENDSLIIAGPCSAESKEQILNTAKEIAKNKKVHIFRSGIWKPRTRPGNFEGVGEKGLKWLQDVKKETQLLTATEIAKPEHIDLALKYNIDILWIGARTVSNPFSMQEIAKHLKDIDIPIFIKNPINPDLGLWQGAIERIAQYGNKKIAAIHRGFFPFEETKYRNIPKWELAIELKQKFHSLPIICDPSHISGNSNYIAEISQKALDLNLDGLMIETHNNPTKALSDAKQQITPSQLKSILEKLIFRKPILNEKKYILEQYREQIDSIDQQLLELLMQRMKIINQIGHFKLNNKITILQLRRWENIIKTRIEFGKEMNLPASFIKDILQIIHKESIRQQNEIMNTPPN